MLNHALKMAGAVCAFLLLGLAPLGHAQDDHSGHDHEGHDHGEEVHAPAVGGHDDHDGHDHGEEHSDEVTLSAEAMTIANITVARAERRALTGTVTVPARVSYNAEAVAHIGSQVQGRVQRIAARLGDEVRAGDVLLVIDSPELGAAQSSYLQGDAGVDAAQFSVDAASAMIEVARIAFERAEKLRDSSGISTTEFLVRQGALREAEAALLLAEGQMRVATAARLAAENQLHMFGYRHEDCDLLLLSGEIDTRYEVRAPISGLVVERQATIGEVVSPASAPLMVVADMKSLWVLADVPERHIGGVALGTPARFTMSALGTMAFEGTVSYIAPALDSRTRTATVRIVVGPAPAAAESVHQAAGHDHHEGDDHAHDHAEERLPSQPSVQLLKPGMFGTAEISLSPAGGQAGPELVVVPHGAVLTVEGAKAVFVPVPGEPNTFAKRVVQVGERVGQYLPVYSGLSEGEEFVATNPFLLKAELGKAGAAHVH